MLAEGRAILESHLGSLLGFDDGVSDILDHLLTIESREDLLEYLSQLLGDETPGVIDFVENVGRFQRGENMSVVSGQDSTSAFGETKPQAKGQKGQQPTKASASETTKKEQSKNEALTNRKNQKQNKSRVPPPMKNNQQKSNPTNNSNAKKPATAKQKPPPNATKPEKDIVPSNVKKSRPPKGKPKIICGCFGTKHKALTNCLYCGRIACVEEGYDFCGFCGYLVEEIKDGTHDGDAAWIQKERLLRFDREFARRTEIFDDQADFQGPSTWMTEEELEEAEEKRIQQIESMKRQKQTLNLAI